MKSVWLHGWDRVRIMCKRGSSRRKCHGRGGIRESTRKQIVTWWELSWNFRVFEDVLYKFRFLTRSSPQDLKWRCGRERQGQDWGLVLRHTFSSSTRWPCNPYLGGFSKLKNFFTYLVALESCVQALLFGTQMTEHISCLTSTEHRFYGSTLMFMQRHNEVQCQCHGTGMARISGWGEEAKLCLRVYSGWDTSSQACILWKSYQRILVRLM